MTASFVSFAPTLIVLDQSNPFRMTVRGAITGPGQAQAAGIMTVGLPHGASITSFGITGNLAYGVVDASLIRNSLSPDAGFDVLATRQFTATSGQDFNQFSAVLPASEVDNANFTYLIEASAVAKNVPFGQQFSAFIFGFGMILDV